jgi:aminoglycoside N3'-acetyltransferase
MPTLTLADIFEELRVPRHGVIILHSSMDWMWRIGLELDEALATLTSWTGDRGTLVVPTFPFVRAHREYLLTRPHMDVRTTPTNAGLLNEFIRRLPDTHRSRDPDLTLSARGPDALSILDDRPTGPDPHGPDSPFHRVVASGGSLVGLGVTANYMISTHVLDSRFRHRYDFPVYSTETYPATTRDYNGVVHSVQKHAVLENVERNIKPSRQIDLLPPGSDVFRSLTVEGAIFFRWSLPGWEEVCTHHIEERLQSGREPCWHEVVAREYRAEEMRSTSRTVD